jgi:hypothetical protein
VDALVVDGRSEGMIVNWLLDDARSKNNEHTAREMISKERRNTRSLDLCVPILSMSFGKINGVKANLLGRLFGRLSFLFVGVSSY